MFTLWREGALKVQSRSHGGLEVSVERVEHGERKWCKLFELAGSNVSFIVEPVGLDCALGQAQSVPVEKCSE